jgi:hypothetical protein
MLRKASWGVDPKCEAIGQVTIRYAEGTRDDLGFLPSHKEDKFEFRHRWLKYNVSRQNLYQALKLAGVDIAKIPEAGHKRSLTRN